LSGALPQIDLEEVKDKLIEQLRAWGARNLVSSLPYHEKSLDNAFVAVARVMFRYRCGVTWALMRLRRAAATVDASIIYLYPDMDVNQQIMQYMRRATRRSVRRLTGPEMIPRVIQGLATVMENAENAWEQALYQGSLMRRQAQVFEGTTNKFAYLFSVLYRQTSVLLAIAGVLFLAAFLRQHDPKFISPWLGAQVTRFLDTFPQLDPQIWLLILAVNFYFFVVSIKLGKRFALREDNPTRPVS
jgi:predicted unusual protein kinase regulating ubiquinone biosynthesis (AarF/ABC1/UbiB family)